MAKDIRALLGEKGLTEFIRRIVFNAAIGNADMHLKNWSLLYRDGRTPEPAPGYDYVSTMRYLPERGLGLQLAGTKDVSRLDDELLEKASVQAGVPRGLVKDVAHETARSFLEAWSQHKAGLPIDDVGRRKIDEQLQLVPLFKEYAVSGKRCRSPSAPFMKESNYTDMTRRKHWIRLPMLPTVLGFQRFLPLDWLRGGFEARQLSNCCCT